jgi:hypothetical protein
VEDIKCEYDDCGRMKYNPLYHGKHGTPWSTEDLQYLINWYDYIGPEEMSFALERTICTINTKVVEFRKQGVMKRPSRLMKHERINPGSRRKKSCANSSN